MTSLSPLEAIFFAALEKGSPEERAAYLNVACAGDPEVRRRVEKMLAAQAQAGSFLESPAPDLGATTDQPAGEQPGTVIGPYKLLEQIGEGGFGTVFMAEQGTPVRRKVALKVLKAGMDTKQVVARFEAERQALAILDHPNIAKVFDGGATQAGRPYFVMELVKGVPITDFCDRNRLTPRERLELFVPVCQAVQHAHQKGIIHRDLKPSNVLVSRHDTMPTVKVIDFGVAKALGQELTDKTLFTGIAQMIGTPLYMSPEQAGMSDLDVDTRSDVYSLGVLLYELLTGTTPFDKERIRTAGYDEMRRIIREEEPPRPSTRLSTLGQAGDTVSANRGSEPRRLSALVRGELDWVVMKCLEKDRGRRYETANGLAADVAHYLADEPVLACPPTARYRVWKFIRRHPAAIVISGLVLILATLAAGGSAWVVLDRAARHAEAGRQTETALQDGHRFREQKDWAQAREAAKRAVLLLGPGNGHAELRDRLRDLIADLDMVDQLERIRLDQTAVKASWWDHAAADLGYEAAFRGYGVELGSEATAGAAERVRTSAICDVLVAALDDWAWAVPKAAPDRRDRIRAVASGADPDAWRVRFRDPAVQRDRRALEELASRPELAAQPPATAVLIGRALLECGSPETAVSVLSAAQHRHPADFWLNVVLATALNYRIQPPRRNEAIGYLRAALAVRPTSAGIHSGLGHCLLTAGRYEEAVLAFRRAIDLQPDFAAAHYHLGQALAKKDEWGGAVAAYQKSLELGLASAAVRCDLAWAYRHQNATAKAIAEYGEAVRIEPTFALAHRELAWQLATCADLQLRDPVRAREAAERAWKLSPDHPQCARVVGIARYRTNDLPNAIAALAVADAARPEENPYVWFFLAMVHARQGKPDEAGLWFNRAVRWMEDPKKWGAANQISREQMIRFRAEAATVLEADSPQGRVPKDP